MYKTLKFKGEEKDFFFIGCMHHRHDPNWDIPLWKMRGFSSSQEHDNFQIKKWNTTCNDESVVFSLGDMIFNDSTGKEFLTLLNTLKFSELLVMGGNHISGFRQLYTQTLAEQFPLAVYEDNKLNYEVYPLVKELYDGKNVIFLPNYCEIDINGHQIILSHYAIRSWNKMARESWMLHSHEHLANLDSDLAEINKGKIADLGYETLLKYNDGAPISMEKLRKYMNKKQYLAKGHH